MFLLHFLLQHQKWVDCELTVFSVVGSHLSFYFSQTWCSSLIMINSFKWHGAPLKRDWRLAVENPDKKGLVCEYPTVTSQCGRRLTPRPRGLTCFKWRKTDWNRPKDFQCSKRFFTISSSTMIQQPIDMNEVHHLLIILRVSIFND